MNVKKMFAICLQSLFVHLHVTVSKCSHVCVCAFGNSFIVSCFTPSSFLYMHVHVQTCTCMYMCALFESNFIASCYVLPINVHVHGMCLDVYARVPYPCTKGYISLVPRPLPAFQCCMLKNRRAWYASARA